MTEKSSRGTAQGLFGRRAVVFASVALAPCMLLPACGDPATTTSHSGPGSVPGEAPYEASGEASGEAGELARLFDADLAWASLESQVAFGARHSGGPGCARVRDWIAGELESYGLTSTREPFTDTSPIGELAFENLYADLEGAPRADGSPAPVVVLVSHFDTKRLRFAFEGANDSASSTAVLLELARVLSSLESPRPVTYRFLFVDGEEAIREHWAGTDNTYGSRYHVARARVTGDLQRYAACVVLDMVGDADLKLTTELASDRRLLQIFFEAARTGGLGVHVDGTAREISDDHLPFRFAGVPAVDLIDFEYGPNNSYWHSADDSISNCSKESLDAIGRIFLLGLPELERFALSSS